MDERDDTTLPNGAAGRVPLAARLEAVGTELRAAAAARSKRGESPDDRDLDRLQERLWAELEGDERRPVPSPLVSGYPAAPPDVSFALDECELLPAGYEIGWRHPLLGPVNAAIRRQINAEVRRYVDPALAQQTRLNYRLTELIQQIVRDHGLAVQGLRDQLGPIDGLRMEVDALRAAAATLGAELARLRAEARLHGGRGSLRSNGADPGDGVTPPAPDELPIDYLAYSERIGGALELERALYAAFVPLFADAVGPVADLGCGRGPFLDLLCDAGIPRIGIDRSPEMAGEARARGHPVVEMDALAFLEGTADGALGGIFVAHLIEHLPRAALVRLIGECWRALAPGASAVFVSPDPRSLFVLSDTFYKDLSHVAPVHPAALDFLAEQAGFASRELRTLSPVPADRRLEGEDAGGGWSPALRRNLAKLEELLFGDLDYALVARR